ncbi:sensor histidine kinase [Nannocystis pusilla]|uniref:histidine kinase n=1 Tax=Nannocystis pusilla TaxID=889268 RepID=A0ABS7TYK2_9BACT|nr:ATP-binding protein [Nannocystis pusilla]MBZ5713355.1 PAS domain S-box protein [Nannocystis pusilla]
MTSSTLTRLRRLFEGPRFADEETTRVAGIVHLALVVASTIGLVGVLVQIVLFTAGAALSPLDLLFPALSLGLLALLHRGFVYTAGYAIIVLSWGTMVAHSAYTGGLRSSALGGLILVVIVGMLLFGRRTLLGLLGLCFLALLGLYFAEVGGMLPANALEESGPRAYLSRMLHLAAAGVFLSLAVHSLQNALARARAGEVRAEQILGEAERARRYADNILASMAESLVVVDAEGRIQTVNRATLKLLDAMPDQLLGRPFSVVLPEADAPLPHEPQQGLVERVYRAPGGREIPVLYARSPLRGDHGEQIGAVCVASDITHLKRAEGSLREAKQMAEEANQAKSRFLANMSHELRTPLNAVIGYAEMLMEEADERGLEGSLDELRKIQFAGKHLLGLISDILDLSKIEAGRMDVHLETFDVADMVETVLGTIRPLADRGNNRLVVVCPSSIGFIHADLTKTRQILLNLLSNAVKFTDHGEIRLTASKTLRDGTPAVQFIVADSGIGMTQQQLGKLFQAFSQGDSTTSRRFGGTGLGLAISKAFCDILGGTIEVKSQLGIGTVFTVRLPYTDPHELSLSRRSGSFSRTVAEAARVAAARAALKA